MIRETRDGRLIWPIAFSGFVHWVSILTTYRDSNTDKRVLREGADFDGVWLETQPMGGEMYAKRDMEVALNNQLIFLENQRRNGPAWDDQVSRTVSAAGVL